MVENKQIMAKNILYFMHINSVSATEICKACGFKQNTFSDWVNAKTYPRIDKIELMANYFGISKALLVEERKQPEDTIDAFLIREIHKHFTPEQLDDPELAKQIAAFIAFLSKLDSRGRDALLAFAKTLKF